MPLLHCDIATQHRTGYAPTQSFVAVARHGAVVNELER